MHRQVDEWVSIEYLRRRSISGSDWHIQREVLGESLEVFSGCVGGTVEALLVFRTEDIRGNIPEIEYLAIARLHPTGRHWVDNFLLPTLLIHQCPMSVCAEITYIGTNTPACVGCRRSSSR